MCESALYETALSEDPLQLDFIDCSTENVHKIADYLDKLRVKYNISFLEANSENNTNLTNEEKQEVREEIKSFIKNLKQLGFNNKRLYIK